MTSSGSPPRDARDRLIDVAMHVFAERSFGDVATRDLARAAQVSLSAIGYYFRTKSDLHKAAAQRAAVLMVAPLEGQLTGALPSSSEAGVQSLIALVDAVAVVMLSPGSTRGAATQFGLRELVVSGPAADIFQEGVLDPVLQRATALLGVIMAGKLEEPALVIHATSLFGPITLHRILHNRSIELMTEDDAGALQAAIGDVTRRTILALAA